MKVHFGAPLSWYGPQRRSSLEVPLAQSAPLTEVVASLGIPEGEILLVLVNGVTAPLSTWVGDDDRVELYPALGGG